MGNIAEGVVIRPLNDKFHCMAKIKSQKFWEITSSKSKKNVKEEQGRKLPLDQRSKDMRKHVMKCPGADDRFCDFIERCVNEQRLNAVESKIGRLNQKNMGKITWLFVEDVFDELLKEKSHTMKKINGLRQKAIKRFISALIKNFIRVYMQNGCEESEKLKEMDEKKIDETKPSKASRIRSRRWRKKVPQN